MKKKPIRWYLLKILGEVCSRIAFLIYWFYLIVVPEEKWPKSPVQRYQIEAKIWYYFFWVLGQD